MYGNLKTPEERQEQVKEIQKIIAQYNAKCNEIITDFAQGDMV